MGAHVRQSLRVALAAVVLFASVGGLLAAWYVSSRRAQEEALGRGFQAMRRIRLEEEHTAADRLAERLEALRVAESQRPYFHYQNLYHDPKGASAGLSVVPSPLATGPGHPLITAHFQIDNGNRASLPTLNDELQELNAAQARQQKSVREALAQSAVEIRQAAAAMMDRVESEAAAARASAVRIAELEARLAESRQKASKVEVLDQMAFAQNVQSNYIYQQLRSAPGRAVVDPATPAPSTPAPRPAAAPPVQIRTTDLEWRTVTVEGVRTLVALRAVHTPDGTLVQGVLTPLRDGAAVDGAVVRLARNEGTSIGGTGWRAQLPPPVFRIETAERERFQRAFIAVSAVLLLVVISLVWTLWRVERLATDRARFAATAAHELRTPLASLRLYSDLISDEEDAGKREQYARELAGQTERLGRVVANVLEVTRLERGTFSLKPRPGEIGPVVEECVARLKPQLEAANCPIDLHVASGLPEVAFDPDALHHVVDNLLDNAEKFSRDVTNRSISVDVGPEEGGVAIIVSDRGPGVPENLLRPPRPFRRGPHLAPSGLGLGLFLVDRIVRGHGGALRTTRRDGGGASVSVFLPAFVRT